MGTKTNSNNAQSSQVWRAISELAISAYYFELYEKGQLPKFGNISVVRLKAIVRRLSELHRKYPLKKDAIKFDVIICYENLRDVLFELFSAREPRSVQLEKLEKMNSALPEELRFIPQRCCMNPDQIKYERGSARGGPRHWSEELAGIQYFGKHLVTARKLSNKGSWGEEAWNENQRIEENMSAEIISRLDVRSGYERFLDELGTRKNSDSTLRQAMRKKLAKRRRS